MRKREADIDGERMKGTRESAMLSPFLLLCAEGGGDSPPLLLRWMMIRGEGMKCESPGVLLLCLNLDQGLTDRLVNRHAVTVAAAVVRSESRLRRHCGLPLSGAAVAGDTLLRKRRTV